MRSPASAIGWEFRQRHRYALIALGSYGLAFAFVWTLILGTAAPIDLDDSHILAAVVVVPISTSFMYLLGVFSFGFEGDLTGRPSMFPRRLFTMPVSSAALAGWPMVYGAIAVAGLLLSTASVLHVDVSADPVRFTLQPPGARAPLVWPAVLGVVFLAWTQVLTWMAYPLPGLRVIVTVAWLVMLDAMVFLAVHHEVPESVLVAFLAPQLPVAWLAAWFAVSRARRGEVPDWQGVFMRRGGMLNAMRRARKDLSSPAQAQLWFEWRRHGRSLPGWVAILLPFELGLLFLASDEPSVLVFYTLLAILLTPPWMAGFVATNVGSPNAGGRDEYGLTSFLATRPLTSASLIAATLQATVWSTTATWGLVLLAIPVGLTLSGTLSVVVDGFSEVIKFFGPPRAMVVGLLILAGLMSWTWRRLVQRLCIGLTGRERLIKGSVVLSLSFLVVLVTLLQWLQGSGDARARLLDSLPWILGILVAVKLTTAAWVATRLFRSRVVTDRLLLMGAATWLASVFALYGLLEWIFNSPHVAGYFLLLIAILAVPLTRLSAAPLALAWNRHR